MLYKIMSRAQVGRYSQQRHDKRSIVVSICSTWDRELARISCTDVNNIVDVLHVQADDTDARVSAGYGGRGGLMTSRAAREIAQFATKHHDHVDMIVVHCDGGVSRTAGVAAALMRWFEGDEYAVFRSRVRRPNMWCYNLVLDALRGVVGYPQTLLERRLA